jgi:hypothetical protein
MRFSNALMLGLTALTLTFCKKNDEVVPSVPQSEERTIGTEAVSQFNYVITPSMSIVDGSILKLPAGAVVGIEGGSRGPLLLKNFVGADGNPIRFVNKGSKVVINSTGSYGLKFENSKFIRVSGTGDDINRYGIEINGGHITMTMDKMTTNFEIDHMDIHNAGFAGIMAKTDPSCDPATWRNNFTMRNVSLHDNYVHDVKGEGFYVGNSFYASGRSLSCGTIYPHKVENVKIYNNITKNTGCEGIQLGCATSGAEVYNNSVELFGQDPFAPAQNNGIQIGEGSGGKLYNNIVKNGPGNGLIILGLGDNVIYNNVVINAGSNGAFIDERFTTGPGFAFYNNTFINPKSNGVLFYSELVSMNHFINNIIVNPGSGTFINTKSGVRLNQSNNLLTKDINSVKFVNPSANNFALQSISPAINKGANTSAQGVTFDYARVARPQSGYHDIGAYEFSGTVSSPAAPVTSSPAPAPSTTTGLAVTSFSLIDANTDKVIATIPNGYVLNLSSFATRSFNIKVNTNSATAGSIVMKFNTTTRTENSAPFSMFGDFSGDYTGKALSAGSYSMTAIPYSGASASGTKGTPLTVSFTVR